MIPAEEWREIPGHDGRYEVSSLGRVRSFAQRKVRILSPWTTHKGYRKVRLGNGTPARLVHHLVLEAFVGPRPDGKITRHLNGDPSDNRVENLVWGTYAENVSDSIHHGTHRWASRTHCVRGHEFNEENTRPRRGANSRDCRACQRERRALARKSRTAA